MWQDQTPGWLRKLERRFQWIAIPNIAIIIVTLQALGTLMVLSNPRWASRLALVPELVRAGEYWRVITFLAMPLSVSPLWAFFALWFIYFVLNLIENEWGAFKTTLYVLVSVLVMIAFSFAFNYDVFSVEHFETSLFFAAAALFPETEVSLFLVLPVKIKWLAWLSAAFVALEFFQGAWMDRFFLIAVYSNFLLFFGPAIYSRIKHDIRRRRYQRNFRD